MATITTRLSAFLSNPLNATGVLALAATVGNTIITELSTHTLSVPTVVTGAVVGVVAIVWPDNTALKSDVPQLIADVADAVANRNAGDVPKIAQDIANIVRDVTPTPKPMPVIPAA